MKAYITRFKKSNVAPIIKTLSRISTRRIAHAENNQLQLRWHEGILNCRACDGNMEIRSTLSPTVHVNGFPLETFLVDAKKLSDIVQMVSDEQEITFHFHEKSLEVMSENARHVLALHSTLPTEPWEFSSIGTFAIEAEKLITLLDNTSFCMGETEFRNNFNGLLIAAEDNELKGVATDGHRLAVTRMKITEKLSPFSLLFPKEAVIEMRRIIDNEKGKIGIAFNHQLVSIKLEKFIFTFQLLPFRFPPYQRVIQQDFSSSIILPLKELKQALQRVHLFLDAKKMLVQIEIKENVFKAIVSNSSSEMAESYFPIDYSENPVSFKVNFRYLMDIIQASFDYKTIEMRVKSEREAILFRTTQEESNDYVLMPIR